MNTGSKTFWDIKKEKTTNIYILFGFLVVLYFLPIFLIWNLIKLILYFNLFLRNSQATFRVFDTSLLYIIIIAGVIAVIHWFSSSKNVVGKILQLLHAKLPDKNDKYHYQFQNIVDEIETAAGGISVERYIIPTGAMNAFALADNQGRQVIGITEGLLSRLNRAEIQSVVAHEMAHIVSNDCLLTTTACSLFGLYNETLYQLSKGIFKTSSIRQDLYAPGQPALLTNPGLVGVPIIIILYITNLLSQLLNMFISREKEYRADASAVEYTREPLSLASALYKMGMHWRGTGLIGERLAPIFIINPRFSQLDESEGLIPTLFSTHPPLIKRLQVLLNMAHADMEQIARHIKKKIRIVPETADKTPVFLVQKNRKWLGPYTLLQLQTIDGFGPDTLLKLENGDRMMKAREVPELARFFELQKKPISRLRRICPDCRQWLIPESYEGLYIWRCAFCNGVAVGKDKLPRIIVRREKGFTEDVVRLAKFLQADAKKKHPHFQLLLDMTHPRACPKCGQPMIHKFYSYAYHIEIDECQVCRTIWFDAKELELLQCLIEMGGE